MGPMSAMGYRASPLPRDRRHCPPVLSPTSLSQGQNRGWRGLKPPACFDIWLATFHIVENLYDTPFPTEPQNDLQPPQPERNEEIRQRHAEGELVRDLAQDFGISEQRVSQIVRGRRS
jgi:hypothetical protein